MTTLIQDFEKVIRNNTWDNMKGDKEVSTGYSSLASFDSGPLPLFPSTCREPTPTSGVVNIVQRVGLTGTKNGIGSVAVESINVRFDFLKC
jgi:hypothetical protein